MKLLFKALFFVAFVLATGVHKIEWSSVGERQTLSYIEAAEIDRAVCDLARTEKKWTKAQSERYPYTFKRYFEFLVKVESIQDGTTGYALGQSCVQEVMNMAKNRLDWNQRHARHEQVDKEFEEARLWYQDTTNPDWREDEIHSREEWRTETLPALKKWLQSTYLWWTLLSFFYFLLFWRKKDENVIRFGWFAALLYAIFHPITWGMVVKRRTQTFARWVWFETRVRQAQEKIFAPLSAEVRKQAKVFASSNRSITEQRALFLQRGIVSRHGFASALLVTLAFIPIQAIGGVDVDHPPPDAVVEVMSIEVSGDLSLDCTSTVTSVACETSTVHLLQPSKVEIYTLHYVFFSPSPPDGEIFKVPRYGLSFESTLRFNSFNNVHRYEKDHTRFPPVAGIC